jgi:hypothetical protein
MRAGIFVVRGVEIKPVTEPERSRPRVWITCEEFDPAARE